MQLTDSAYVAASMRIMTRMGQEALDCLGDDGDFVPCLHSRRGAAGRRRASDVPWPCNAENKYIVHFPETREIRSYGSGYGGNALLGKKCFALRIASVMARDEGWLAEHMLILKLTSPEGEVKYVAGAFPSACGKTNLSMMIPTLPGWKVETIGDDIAWMKFGKDGRLYAANPEAGFFGVAPGTGARTNPNAIDMVSRNTVFTNCAKTDDGDIWWEGMTGEPPAHAIDWQGNDWTPESEKTAAHPERSLHRARSPSARRSPRSGTTRPGFRSTRCCSAAAAPRSCRSSTRRATGSTACSSARPCPRRRRPRRRAPSASSASTRWRCSRSAGTTWPTTSPTGCSIGRREDVKLPKVFYVNWFRSDEDGKFLWPGFGENSRVLAWIFRRCEGTADAVETPIGLVPPVGEGGIDTDGLDVDRGDDGQAARGRPRVLARTAPADARALRAVRRQAPAGAARRSSPSSRGAWATSGGAVAGRRLSAPLISVRLGKRRRERGWVRASAGRQSLG